MLVFKRHLDGLLAFHLLKCQGEGFFDPCVTIESIVLPDSYTKVVGFGKVIKLYVMLFVIGDKVSAQF